MENLNKIESIENTNEINKENIQDIQYIDLARIEPVIRNDIPGYDEAIVTCDPFSVAHVLDSKQGDNVFGYQSNCGLVSISNVLQLSGINATENDVTGLAISNNLCDNNPFKPVSECGGTYDENIIDILNIYGIESHSYRPDEKGGSYDDIAHAGEWTMCYNESQCGIFVE